MEQENTIKKVIRSANKIAIYKVDDRSILLRGQTAEARRTTIPQLMEEKPHSQKDRQDEKAEGYVSDEGTT